MTGMIRTESRLILVDEFIVFEELIVFQILELVWMCLSRGLDIT